MSTDKEYEKARDAAIKSIWFGDDKTGDHQAEAEASCFKRGSDFSRDYFAKQIEEKDAKIAELSEALCGMVQIDKDRNKVEFALNTQVAQLQKLCDHEAEQRDTCRHQLKDRDTLIEKLEKALEISRGQWIHSVNAELCQNALAAIKAWREGK